MFQNSKSGGEKSKIKKKKHKTYRVILQNIDFIEKQKHFHFDDNFYKLKSKT